MEQQFYKLTRQIDSAIARKKITKEIAQDSINYLKQNDEISKYFFTKVQSHQWFDYLLGEGYFSPEKIKYDDQNNALFWNVLDYLERVSQKLNKKPEYGEKLLDILEGIFDFSQNKKPINNLHIWWYCSKILFNIPFDIIKKELSPEKFRSWLSIWAVHSSLVISDIGEKLLPKFLKEDGAIEYAEVIVDILTEIRAEEKPVIEKTNVIIKRKEALLLRDNYWVLEAFKKNPQIGQKCSFNAIFNFANKLKGVIAYQQQIQYDITPIGDDVYRIEVSRVAAEENKPGELAFKEGVFDCSVKQFSTEQLKGVDRQNLWTFYNITPEIPRSETFQITAFNQGQFRSQIINELPKEIKWESSVNFKEKMELLFEHLHSDFSYIHFKSLQKIDFNLIHSAEKVLTVILRDIIIARCEAKSEDGRKLLEAFLGDNYPFPIFRRLVLLCIDKYWSDYNDLLDGFFRLIPTALDKPAFEVELYDLLKNNNHDFKTSLLEKLKHLIGDVPEYYIKKGENLPAYWQFKWLSSLKDNPAFSYWYKEIEQKAEPRGGKPYEPERSTITSSWSIGSKSPKTFAEILKMPIAELVKFLHDFKGTDRWNGAIEGEPDKEGLADAFHAAIKEEPKKFVDEIDAFYGLEKKFLARLFRGLRDAWKDKKEFDWGKVFDLVLKICGDSKRIDIGDGNNSWFVEEIVGLIEDGCNNDAHAFNATLFKKAEDIFDCFIPLLKGEENPDIQRDALMYAMNTSLGRTIMAYVAFSLRIARVTKKKEDDWGKKKYERFFSEGIEADIWFGGYLPQIKYLDEKYTKDKIEYFDKTNQPDFKWRMFMEGYLHGGSVYQDLYQVMRSHCLKALDEKDFNEEINSHLIEYISLGYLHFNELLQLKNNDGQYSLFWKMLLGDNAINKKERWLRVAGFFGSRKEDKIFNKIVEFWKWTYENRELVKTTLGDDYNSFLSKMSALLNALDKVDGEKENWILLCAPFVDLHHNAMFFTENLTKFDDEESIKHIGKIYLKALESSTPMYKQEDILLVVRKIYEKGNRDDADAICNTYGRRGVHFLKPLWEEFQKK